MEEMHRVEEVDGVEEVCVAEEVHEVEVKDGVSISMVYDFSRSYSHSF